MFPTFFLHSVDACKDRGGVELFGCPYFPFQIGVDRGDDVSEGKIALWEPGALGTTFGTCSVVIRSEPIGDAYPAKGVTAIQATTI